MIYLLDIYKETNKTKEIKKNLNEYNNFLKKFNLKKELIEEKTNYYINLFKFLNNYEILNLIKVMFTLTKLQNKENYLEIPYKLNIMNIIKINQVHHDYLCMRDFFYFLFLKEIFLLHIQNTESFKYFKKTSILKWEKLEIQNKNSKFIF